MTIMIDKAILVRHKPQNRGNATKLKYTGNNAVYM